jgi:zinc D-Ala-D-Ala dipeptidase
MMKYGFGIIFLLCITSPLCAQSAPDNFELLMIQAGLVDIQTLDSTIQVDLKYSTMDNFLNADVYGNLSRCYLQKEAAAKLVKAQQKLKEKYPHYTLQVFDGARPRRVQRAMWEIVKNTPKQGYVGNPDKGSIHNYGCAVDLTVADSMGKSLDMGTAFDYLGKLAQPRYEDFFLESGKLTLQHIHNRLVLRKPMTEAGFQIIPNEWWHFEAFGRKVATQKYKIIE